MEAAAWGALWRMPKPDAQELWSVQLIRPVLGNCVGLSQMAFSREQHQIAAEALAKLVGQIVAQGRVQRATEQHRRALVAFPGQSAASASEG